LDEDELAKAIPQGSALQESNAVIKLRKLMDDVSGRQKRINSNLRTYTHYFFFILTMEYLFFSVR